MSFRGASPHLPVDIFRLKWHIEDVIRRSGVPYVILRPTAFMDVWIDQLIADGIRRKGVATLFGDGTAVANYIAVEDVAEFAVKILGRVLVSMLLSIRCSCSDAAMFSYVARLVLGFPRSRCRPNSLCAFAVLLGLVE